MAPTLTLAALVHRLEPDHDRARRTKAQPYLETLPADLTVRLSTEAIVAAKLGDRAASDRKLEQLDSSYGEAASYQFAQAYAQRGEPDRAFAALERGFAVNDPGLNTLAGRPVVRSDPRRRAVRRAAQTGRRQRLGGAQPGMRQRRVDRRARRPPTARSSAGAARPGSRGGRGDSAYLAGPGRGVAEQRGVERVKPVLELERLVPAALARRVLELGAQPAARHWR